MCDPFTLMGAGVSAYGAFAGGQAAGAQADVQEAMWLSNAETLEVQAEIAGEQVPVAYQRAGFSEHKLREGGKAVLGAQTHHYASSHLDPAYGSPLLHQALTVMEMERDVDLIRANGQIEAADAKTKAANVHSGVVQAYGNALSASMKGDAARMAGFIGAGTALLGGLSKSGAFGDDRAAGGYGAFGAYSGTGVGGAIT